MQFICPNPLVWNKVYVLLKKEWQQAGGHGPQPPKPLIIDLWAKSSDTEKAARWQATLNWALENSCYSVVSNVSCMEMYTGSQPVSANAAVISAN